MLKIGREGLGNYRITKPNRLTDVKGEKCSGLEKGRELHPPQ